MAGLKFVDTDQVKPVEIEHCCEEIFDGNRLVEKYNYFRYHFEQHGRYFWARTYKDEIAKVSIYGPFDRRDGMKPVAGLIDDEILAYFRRRFKTLERFSDGKYVSI
jgi:hypothetical protein